jgi:hypothetical protein
MVGQISKLPTPTYYALLLETVTTPFLKISVDLFVELHLNSRYKYRENNHALKYNNRRN